MFGIPAYGTEHSEKDAHDDGLHQAACHLLYQDDSHHNKEEEQEQQFDFSAIARKNVIQAIKNLDMDNITPREAYAQLEEFKKMLE